MSVKINCSYRGDLQCEAVHGPSGQSLFTDAPVDNNGKGSNFSPTDLVATAVGMCAMTVIGIVGKRHEIDLKGMRASVEKEMGSVPNRHISKINVRLTLPAALSSEKRDLLERTAKSCPVANSLSANTKVDLEFVYE